MDRRGPAAERHDTFTFIAGLQLILLLVTFTFPFSLLIYHDTTTAQLRATDGHPVTVARALVSASILAVAFLRSREFWHGLARAGILLLFAAFCLLSVLWSVDQWVTFRQAIVTILFITSAAMLVSMLTPVQLVRLVALYLAFLMVASMLMVLLMPTYGRHFDPGLAGEWRGVFPHKNLFGPVAAIAAGTFLIAPELAFEHRRWGWPIAIVSLVCLTHAGSDTSVVALVAALAVCAGVRWARPSMGVAVVGALIALPVGAIFWNAYFADILALLGREPTLTGRTLIWQITWSYVERRPLFGYGFAAATTDILQPILASAIGPSAVDPHSGYLDILAGVGVVGIVLWMATVLRVVAGALMVPFEPHRATRQAMAVCAFIVAFSILHAVTEVESTSVTGALGPFCYFAIVVLLLHRRDRGAGNRPELTPGRSREQELSRAE